MNVIIQWLIVVLSVLFRYFVLLLVCCIVIICVFLNYVLFMLGVVVMLVECLYFYWMCVLFRQTCSKPALNVNQPVQHGEIELVPHPICLYA